MNTIKKYCEENIHIQITDFELRDVSIYGCDALFYFEIRDDETDVVLDTDCETVENAFMGVDDGEEIYYFLEEKGIDFSEEYDDDYDRLPDELKKEYDAYLLDHYNDLYHDYFFDADEDTQQEYIDKIMDQLYLASNRFYIIKDKKACWIVATEDYFGVHLSSDDVKIHKVYNVNMQEYIYEVDGIYFNICCRGMRLSVDFYIELFERDEEHPYVVNAEDLANDVYPGYQGDVGDVIYSYNDL